MSLRHQSEGGQSPLGVIWRKKGSGDRALEPPNVKRRGVCVCVCGGGRINKGARGVGSAVKEKAGK